MSKGKTQKEKVNRSWKYTISH